MLLSAGNGMIMERVLYHAMYSSKAAGQLLARRDHGKRPSRAVFARKAIKYKQNESQNHEISLAHNRNPLPWYKKNIIENS